MRFPEHFPYSKKTFAIAKLSVKKAYLSDKKSSSNCRIANYNFVTDIITVYIRIRTIVQQTLKKVLNCYSKISIQNTEVDSYHSITTISDC
jgi:hypothetical protein